jgi:hypothetical protein
MFHHVQGGPHIGEMNMWLWIIIAIHASGFLPLSDLPLHLAWRRRAVVGEDGGGGDVDLEVVVVCGGMQEIARAELVGVT